MLAANSAAARSACSTSWPLQHDVGAVLARRLQLGQGDPDGHEDRRGDAELARGERDALGVVAGRGRDDAARLLVVGQLREAVVGAPDLVRAGALQVLALEVHGRPEQLGEEPRALHRRDAGDARDALARLPRSRAAWDRRS